MSSIAELITAASTEHARESEFAALERALRASPGAGRAALDADVEGTSWVVWRAHPAHTHQAWLAMISAMLATGSDTCLNLVLHKLEVDLWPDRIDGEFFDLLLAQGLQHRVLEMVSNGIAGIIDSYYEGIERGKTDPWGNFEPPEITAGIVGDILAQLPIGLQAAARFAVRSHSGEIANIIDQVG